MDESKILFLGLVVIFFLGGVVGYGIKTVIYILKFNEYDGLSIRNIQNHSDVLDRAYSYDSKGDWVCINSKGLTYNRCVEVASHECAHELFAEICEKDKEFCEDIEFLLNNKSLKE